MKKKNEVAVREEKVKAIVPLTPNEMILAAVNGKADLDKVKQLMELQRDWEANEAKKVYTIALSAFKENVPDLKRDKTNKQYNSTYISKGNLIKTLTPILSKFGLSANFSYENLPDNKVKVTCRLTHKQGHSEEVSFSAPADVSGSKNPIQQLKSTNTYLEKITFAGILGVESNEELDDDGNAAGTPVELIDEKQIGQLTDMVNDLKGDSVANMKQFKATMKIAELSEILKPNFKKAVDLLVARKKQIG